MNAYKFLARGAVNPFTGVPWAVPSAGGPGAWVAADGVDGAAHGCRVADFPHWLHDELWEIELSDPVREIEDEVVGSTGRLVRRVAQWNADTARRFGEWCVARLRDFAAEIAEHERMPALASALRVAPIGATLASAAERLPAEGQLGLARDYLRDACAVVTNGAPATVAYVAHIARSDARFGPLRPAGSERDAQAAWLRAALGL